MRWTALILMNPLWLGCDPGKESDGSGSENGEDSASEGELELPDGLNGEVVDSRGPLPAFHAMNQDGELRGSADLEQGPSVVWFFPAAGTYG